MFYHDLPFVCQQNKMIPGSIHTFWYQGLAENNEKQEVRKRAISRTDSIPDSEADFSKEKRIGCLKVNIV